MSNVRHTQQTQSVTHTQQRNRVHADFASVENSDGVVFSKGVMQVEGVAQLPATSEQWESSNGTTVYTTVMWEHPTTREKRVSCNCPGWARKKPGQLRRCKHTDHMMGISSCTDRRVVPTTAVPRPPVQPASPTGDNTDERVIRI